MASIDEALAELRLQEAPVVRATARKFGVVESTLRRRFKCQTVSVRQSRALLQQLLSPAQERALILQINRMTDRGLPPTPRMIRNFAEEMIQAPVGKNWAGRFVKRHQSELKSIYLRNMDSQRVKAEYAPVFKQFFDRVSHLLSLNHE